MRYGIWDQVRVDHGKEFFIVGSGGTPERSAQQHEKASLSTDIVKAGNLDRKLKSFSN